MTFPEWGMLKGLARVEVTAKVFLVGLEKGFFPLEKKSSGNTRTQTGTFCNLGQ